MKIVAIDGPSGSGKGTIAKKLAKLLNYNYIDTGAMYRCVSYKSIINNVDINDKESLVKILKESDIRITSDGECFLDNENVSNEIRTKEVTKRVSKISPIKELRDVMKEKQIEMGEKYNIVMEGRDITTEIFPNADYKFYLDASVDVRTERRYKQMLESGNALSKEEIRKSIEERDYDDMNREFGALRRTNDQVYIDSSNLSIDEVVDKMLEVIK